MSKKSSKKELKNRILELNWELEAANSEIDDLIEQIADQQRRIVELINENDRLTITYEPFIPEDDPDYGREFFEILEENKELNNRVTSLVYRLDNINRERNEFQLQLWDLQKAVKEMKPKHKKCGVISFDFWPLRDWFRFNYHKWNPGMAAQLCIGPFRIDWFAD